MKYYHLEQLSDVLKKMGFSAIKIQKGKTLSWWKPYEDNIKMKSEDNEQW